MIAAKPRPVLALAAVIAALVLAALTAAAAVRVPLRDMHPPRVRVDPSRRPGAFRDVAFRTPDALLLRGWYAPPRNGAVVVLAHGHGANRTQLLPQAEALAAAGFGVLLFDFRAHGESEGSLATSGDAETGDVEAAVAFVRRQEAGRPVAVGALGLSMGAMAIAHVGARDRALRAFVLESAPPTLEVAIRAQHASPRSLAAALDVRLHRLAGIHVDRVRPVDELCGFSPRPVFLVYGAEDPDYHETGALMAAAACDPKSLWIVPGSGHVPTDPRTLAELDRRVVAFFKSALLGSPDTRTRDTDGARMRVILPGVKASVVKPGIEADGDGTWDATTSR